MTSTTGDGADSTADAAPDVICSAKDCRRPATWVLVWNNPSVHASDREKKWTACDAHQESLSEFLELRSFLKRVEPLPRQSDQG